MTPRPFGIPDLTSLATLVTLSVTVFMSSMATAHARDWYVINGDAGTCASAESVMPDYPTPELFRNQLRAEGVSETVEITEDKAGGVSIITESVSQNGRSTSVKWFPAATTCESYLQVFVAAGAIPNMKDPK
jgi:hypothetical protein